MFDKILTKLIIKLSGIDCSKKDPIDYEILLRSPGQSIDDKISKIMDNFVFKLFFSSFIIFSIIVLIVIFHLSFYYELIIISLYFIYLIILIKNNIKTIRNFKLGRAGEKALAQYLYIVARQLSKEDANMHIYHDLINKRKKFNIDHVVVSKKGIFIFETKTYRKGTKKNTIKSDGKDLFKNGYKMENNIPLQIKGQVKWLQSELKQITGSDYDIIPVIAFIGWHVEGDEIDNIKITNAKNLKYILENQYSKHRYDDKELKVITSAIHKLATVKEENVNDICK